MKFVAILSGLCLMFGCGSSATGPETRIVRGQVTLDQKLIDSGDIVFEPIDGSASSAGRIESGRYSFPSRLGEMLVRITALEAVPGKPGEGTKDLADVDPNTPTVTYRSIVPRKYNRDSKLSAVVTSDGPNTFDFVMTSK